MPNEAESALARAPDEAAARRYLADAKAAGSRDAAVAFLRALYLKTRHPGLWAAVSAAFTGPEMEGLAPPEAVVIGPEQDKLLPRRPYRDVLLSSLTAPFASAGSVFMLVVSGPLLLGCIVAMKLLGCLGLAAAAFLYGYLCAYLFDVLLQAAEGRERAPRLLSLIWYEGSRFEFVFHFGRWLGATAAAFWPLVAVILAAGNSLPSWGWTALGVAGFVLTAWYPIALLQAGYGNGFSAFHYPRACGLVRRLGANYAACAALFLATNLAVIGLQVVLGGWAASDEDRQMIGRVIVGWVGFASWQIQMRAAGLLAWARADVRPPAA